MKKIFKLKTKKELLVSGWFEGYSSTGKPTIEHYQTGTIYPMAMIKNLGKIITFEKCFRISDENIYYYNNFAFVESMFKNQITPDENPEYFL